MCFKVMQLATMVFLAAIVGSAVPAQRLAAQVLMEAAGESASKITPRTGPTTYLPKPGAKFRDCPKCPEMVVVPAGNMTTEAKINVDDTQDDGGTARHIEMPKAFAVGKFDVTISEYQAFVRETGWPTRDHCRFWNATIYNYMDGGRANWQNPGFEQTGDMPVVCLSRADALAYIDWLNAKVRLAYSAKSTSTGGPYRLPSADELEYAARGGTTTRYYWGDRVTHDNANFGADDCHPCRRPAVAGRDRWWYTSPVGSFPPNPFGLYDMAGNVAQLTNTCLNDDVPPHASGGQCKSGLLTNDDEWELTKGGSWLAVPNSLASAAHLGIDQYGLQYDVGFRVIRDLDGHVGARDPSPAGDQTIQFPVRTVSKLTPADTGFRDCRDCPAMIIIPPGRFMMGSPPTEYGRYDVEGPQHLVNIAYAFAVSAYHITVGEYRQFVHVTGRPDDGACRGGWRRDVQLSWNGVGFHQTERDPVMCVSWDDAKAYIAWLNRKVRRSLPSAGADGPYRLLTEAEFEYAARAGTATPFYWGPEASHAYANYGLDPCCGPAREGRDRWLFTSPVGSFPPNAFGLHDMLGNAWTYTEDCWNLNYIGAPNDGSAWKAGDCTVHPARGGGWDDPPRFLRVAARWAAGKSRDSHSPQLGFRVARTLY
jgi:formylglycine-generating enzyme required for sulfatase activity